MSPVKSESGNSTCMTDQKKIINALEKRANGHRWVAGITASVACIVILFALSVFWIMWDAYKYKTLGSTNENGTKKESSEISNEDKNSGPGNILKDESREGWNVLNPKNIIGFLFVSMLMFIARFLMTMYRYNMRLSGHYFSRAIAIELSGLNEKYDLKILVDVIDSNNVNYGNLPKNSMETIDKLVGLIKK